MKGEVLHSLSSQVAFALHDVIKTNAANIHSTQDWLTLFNLLEVTGAGTLPPTLLHNTLDLASLEYKSDVGACCEGGFRRPDRKCVLGAQGSAEHAEVRLESLLANFFFEALLTVVALLASLPVAVASQRF